jgi:hypothetical protein
MSANSAKVANAPAAPAANAKSANAKPASKGFFAGLFGAAKKNAPNVGSRAAGNTNSNAAIAAALQKEEMAKAKAAPSFLPSFLGGKTQAQKNAEAAAASVANGVTGVNTKAVAALNASLATKNSGVTELRNRTRKQRGGAYRGKTMRLPGARNVLRVTGKTARKLGRVGVYGLKKVGNGVHVVTGLLGGLLGKGGKMMRKMTKMTRRNRKN